MSAEQAPAKCPSCQRELPDAGSFATWCPACDWNIEPKSGFIEWKSTALDDLINRVRASYAKRQFEDLVAREPASLRSHWTRGKIFSYALAALINLLPFLLLAAGIWVIVADWPQLWALFWGGVIVFAAWVFRPFRARMPKNLLDRSTAPRLYAFVDRVAAANGAPKVHALVVDADFNASYQRVGLLKRPVVTIGLPLWSILDPQERVALLSHEFAHGMNKDSLSRGFVGNAVATLMRLAYLTQPDTSDFFTILLSPILAAISGAFRWLAYLMVTLLWQRAQEQEFLADFSAAQVGGSAVPSSLLQKMELGAYIDAVLVPISFSSDWQKHNFFPAFRDYITRLPPLEQERRRRLFERADFKQHTTHPPSWTRLKFVERQGLLQAYQADAQEMAAIDQELSRLEKQLTGRLLDMYFPHH